MRHSAGMTSYRTGRTQKGLGIIEVLVALVVVSFGVLGMAGLQLTGMKHSTGGFNRSKALLLTENMATRMRINEAGVESAAYDDFLADKADTFCKAQPQPYCQASKDAEAQRCDADELAAFDLYSVACGDWGEAGASEGVLGLLPRGKMTVNCNDSPCVANSVWVIDVEWTEGSTTSKDPDDVTTRHVRMRLRP